MASNKISFNTYLILNVFTLLLTVSSIAQVKNGETNMTETLINKINLQYHPNVIGISKDGLIEGRDAMTKYLLGFNKDQGSIKDFKTHYSTPVHQLLEYEIGSFRTKKEGQFAHIIIWSIEQGSKQRIAEVVFERIGKIKIPSELAKARKSWVKLCSEKNAKKLVTELYTEDAIYFNRGRILRGHSQLSQEYRYMENPSYTLQLTPKHIEMVTEDLIFEIGLCSGSYNLPYILVWKKQSDGNWKVYMDSNY